MTLRMRAKRMRLLIASFVAILGLVATLKWTLARLDAVATRNAVGRKPKGWVSLNGVEYRPTQEVSPPDRDSRRTHRASVEACDPVGGGRLWKVTIREGTWPESGQDMVGMQGRGMLGLKGQGMLDPPWLSEDHFRAQYTLKLAARGREILATSTDGGRYLVDPETHQVRQVQAPTTPKRPIRDARLPGGTRCDVHDRPLLEDMVPIRYGLNAGVGNPEEYEVRRARFPNATTWIGGGCLVEASREARVLYCPECRGAESERARMPAVERAGDEDPRAGWIERTTPPGPGGHMTRRQVNVRGEISPASVARHRPGVVLDGLPVNLSLAAAGAGDTRAVRPLPYVLPPYPHPLIDPSNATRLGVASGLAPPPGTDPVRGAN